MIYTQLCNERGGIEADLTIVRLATDHFYVVTGSGFSVRDGGWLRQQGVELKDVTSSRAVLNVQGPRSRELLSRVSEEDFSNAAFPYLAAREVRLGFAPVLALRVTYAGELGWELHVPTEYALHLYEALWDAGQDLGVANAGYRALDSLRLEKGYRYWSSELSPDTNPYEVGLGFAVALEKGDFIGREALRKAKGSVKRKLACFLMDGFVPLHGGEAILHEGKVIDTVTSGGYGHTRRQVDRLWVRPGGTDEGFRDRELRQALSGARERAGALRSGAPQDPGVSIRRPAYSIESFASRTTFAHFSISLRWKARNASLVDAAGFGAQLEPDVLHVGLFERLGDGGLQPVGDRARRAGGKPQSVPGGHLERGHAGFRRGRNLGE